MRFDRCRSGLCLLALAIALFTLAPAPAQGASDLVLILDGSGSMWGQIEGENKIVIARRVLSELIDALPDDQTVALVAYGHRRKADCSDIELVAPLAAIDKAALKATVNGLNPKGKTPITKSVQQAFEVIRGRPQGATVILVSDGLETCNGDPCAAVRAAKQEGINFVMHIVGFDVAGEDVSQLECAAQAGNGLFLSAENACELGAALEAAVALPVDVPAGQLSVKALADGELHDVSINVSHAGTGEEAGSGRTYGDPATNPRLIPLADGRYDVTVVAVGLRGDVRREFQIEIADGGLIEKELDFSTGEIAIGVTRNGELSDAVYKVLVAGSGEEAASGRTYTSAKSNPAVVRITAGDYEVRVGSVEIVSRPWAELGRVTVAPQGRVAVSQDYASGLLKVGARRDGELVDVVVKVYDAGGKQVATSRTYTAEKSNPKSFTLEPGTYRVRVKEVRGAEAHEFEVTVVAGGSAEHMVEVPSND